MTNKVKELIAYTQDRLGRYEEAPLDGLTSDNIVEVQDAFNKLIPKFDEYLITPNIQDALSETEIQTVFNLVLSALVDFLKQEDYDIMYFDDYYKWHSSNVLYAYVHERQQRAVVGYGYRMKTGLIISGGVSKNQFIKTIMKKHNSKPFKPREEVEKDIFEVYANVDSNKDKKDD